MSGEIIDSLLKSLKEQKDSELLACSNIDSELRELSDRMQTLQEERLKIANPFMQNQFLLESEIKKLVIAMSKSYKSDYGAVNFRSGYIKRSYNPEALDKICDANEMVKTMIYPFRTATPVPPSVTIKLKE